MRTIGGTLQLHRHPGQPAHIESLELAIERIGPCGNRVRAVNEAHRRSSLGNGHPLVNLLNTIRIGADTIGNRMCTRSQRSHSGGGRINAVSIRAHARGKFPSPCHESAGAIGELCQASQQRICATCQRRGTVGRLHLAVGQLMRTVRRRPDSIRDLAGRTKRGTEKRHRQRRAQFLRGRVHDLLRHVLHDGRRRRRFHGDMGNIR